VTSDQQTIALQTVFHHSNILLSKRVISWYSTSWLWHRI